MEWLMTSSTEGVTVDVIPDDVLIDVFNFYLNMDAREPLDEWHKLVHVCRRWRQVVFASPRRLNLRLLCRNKRPVKKLLDIWPALPIVLEYGPRWQFGDHDATDVAVALEHNDRICEITFNHPRAVPSRLLNSMNEPIPALTSLELQSQDEIPPALPSSFLGGSAPRLQHLTLINFRFPGRLILSAHHLVHLHLWNIDFVSISPVGMVICLSLLTSLESLNLGFRSHSRQLNRHPPPITHTVLPSLTSLSLWGASEDWEDILAQIDVPLLNRADITIKTPSFHELVSNTPQLRSFISRSEAFKAFHQAEMLFYGYLTKFILYNGVLRLEISCEPPDRVLSAMARLCNSFLPPLPSLERLNICGDIYWRDFQTERGNQIDPQLLEVLNPFIKVKSLYLNKVLARCVAPALQDLSGEGVIEVLPALQNISVEGPVQQGIAQFVAARQLLGHPVAVQDWDGKRL